MFNFLRRKPTQDFYGDSNMCILSFLKPFFAADQLKRSGDIVVAVAQIIKYYEDSAADISKRNDYISAVQQVLESEKRKS